MVKKEKNSVEVFTLPKKWMKIGGVIFVVVVTITILALIFGTGQTGRFGEVDVESSGSVGEKTLYLKSEGGSPVSADKVILDGIDKGAVSEGKITIEGLNSGDHQVVIIINGVKYSKSFSFAGSDVLLQLGNPVQVKVSVWTKANKPLDSVKVYIDEEGVQCTTNIEGVCSFLASPEKHVFKLEGNGVFHEETKTVSKDSSGFTFKVERKLQIRVTVTDDLNTVLPNVQVSLDGSPKGLTKQDGTFDILDVTEGLHFVEVSYKDLTEKISASAGDSVKVVFKTPKNIEVKLIDELTSQPISGASISLDNLGLYETATNGIVSIPDIKQGSHTLSVTYKQISKSESIIVSTTQLSFTIKIKAPRSVTIQLKDTNTQKSIKGVTAVLKSLSSGIAYQSIRLTDDNGTTVINDVLPETYQLSIEGIPLDIGTIIPAKQVTVGSNTQISESIDMPNPSFTGTISCEESFLALTGGTCTVKLKNQASGNSITSQDTVVVILVYIEGNPSYVDSDLLNFGRISPGQESTLKTKRLSFQFGKKENVIGLIYEGWRYTPESKNFVSTTTIPPGILEEALVGVVDYCKNQPDVCIKTVSGVIGLIY